MILQLTDQPPTGFCRILNFGSFGEISATNTISAASAFHCRRRQLCKTSHTLGVGDGRF